MAESNRKTLDPDFFDTLLRGRKLMRRLLVLLVIGVAAWVLLESARALTLF